METTRRGFLKFLGVAPIAVAGIGLVLPAGETKASERLTKRHVQDAKHTLYINDAFVKEYAKAVQRTFRSPDRAWFRLDSLA